MFFWSVIVKTLIQIETWQDTLYLIYETMLKPSLYTTLEIHFIQKKTQISGEICHIQGCDDLTMNYITSSKCLLWSLILIKILNSKVYLEYWIIINNQLNLLKYRECSLLVEASIHKETWRRCARWHRSRPGGSAVVAAIYKYTRTAEILWRKRDCAWPLPQEENAHPCLNRLSLFY